MTSSQKLPIVVIACQVFQGLIERYLPDKLEAQITFLDYGLHSVPNNLTQSLQDSIDHIDKPSLVVLGYGLCGNGLDGIQAGKHTLVVPHADDCIAIFLGSQEAYKIEFSKNPGTYYLTKGWLKSGSNPLDEYHRYVGKYGEDKASWIMDQQYKHYKRIVFVSHTQDDLDAYRPKAREVAKYCSQWGMKYEEYKGSNEFLVNLIDVANDLDHADSNFVVVRPGGELRQSHFIRLS
jgi:hypothetical protein